MNGYAGMDQDVRYDANALESLVARLFENAGLGRSDAAAMAAIIRHTDLRGIYSHGCAAVPGYLSKLRSGSIRSSAEARIVRQHGAVVIVDADGGLGHLGCRLGMEVAISQARSTGIAIAAITNSNHCGAMAFYAEQAVAAGMIGFCATNALPTMAPWGGLDRIVGINPIGIGIPAQEGIPLLLDMSFSPAARGKFAVHAEKGIPLPDGWAFDADGVPTTDPIAAMSGLNQPIGGPKGVGLGIAFGMISALLSDGLYGSELGDPETGAIPGRDGQVMIAIDPGMFTDAGRMRRRVDGIVDEVHASRPRTPGQEVLFPGEPEIRTARRLGSEGIPIAPHVAAGLRDALAHASLDPALLDRAAFPTTPSNDDKESRP